MRELRLRRADRPLPARRLRYALFAVAIAVLAVAGYLGYVIYPRFELPAVIGIGLLVLAAGAGLASFFSPCSFPLLLTLLGREVRGTSGLSPTRAAFVFGSAFAAGAATFTVLVGAVLAAGGGTVVGSVTFTSRTGITVRMVVGAVLIALGLIQSGVLPVSLHGVERVLRPMTEAQVRYRRRHPVAGFALFGFTYLLIGFG